MQHRYQLEGYRAAIFPGEYDPPEEDGVAHPPSVVQTAAHEGMVRAEYKRGWELACLDQAAARLEDAGLFCRVRTMPFGPEIIGGASYEPEVREGIGMFTGTTFVVRIEHEGDMEGCIRAAVVGKKTDEAVFGGGPEAMPAAMAEVVDFVIGYMPSAGGPYSVRIKQQSGSWAAVHYYKTEEAALRYAKRRGRLREYIWAVFHKGRKLVDSRGL
jgi:hypothetical protein